MVKITYNKSDMSRFRKEFTDARARVTGQIRMIIQASVFDVMTMAKMPGYVPYKTGNLRRSINQKVEIQNDKVIGYVGSNVDYAAIQEFGGNAGRGHRTKINGRFYMTRSVKDNTQKIKDRFAKMKIINK